MTPGVFPTTRWGVRLGLGGGLGAGVRALAARAPPRGGRAPPSVRRRRDRLRHWARRSGSGRGVARAPPGRPRRRGRPRLGRPSACLVRGRAVAIGLDEREERGRSLAPPARRRLDRLQRGFQLRAGRRGQPRILAEDRRRSVEGGFVALDQLDLELDEPFDDPAPGDHVDLVEAHLDARVGRLELPLPAELADRDDFNQRRVAALLEDERPRVGGRPIARAGRSIRRSLELLAPVGAARARPPGERLDRYRRPLGGLAEAGREARASERAVGRVEVAILELRRADGLIAANPASSSAKR